MRTRSGTTGVAGSVTTCPSTFTRPARIASVACARERIPSFESARLRGTISLVVPTFRSASMPQNAMRLIGLLKQLDLLGRQLNVQGLHGFIQVSEFRGADDRRGDARLRKQPGEGDLRRLHAHPVRHLDGTRRNSKVVVRVVHLLRELVAFGAGRLAAILLPPIAGEEATRQRAPRDEANALLAAE